MEHHHPSDGRLRDVTEQAKQVADLAGADVDAAQRGASEVGDGAESLRSDRTKRGEATSSVRHLA